MNWGKLIIFMICMLFSRPASAQDSAPRLLAFAADDTIYTIETTGENLHELGAGSNPVWSPDGSRLAFQRDQSLWVMDADGDPQQMVAGPNVFGATYQWSPNGTYLAYQAVDPTDSFYPIGLFVVNVTGEALSHPISEHYVPWYAWNADGTQIAYVGAESRLESYPATIEVVEIDSGKRTVLSSIASSYDSVSWSPDGTQLAILKQYGEGTVLELTIQASDASQTDTFNISTILEDDRLVMLPQIDWSSESILVREHTYAEGTRQSIWLVNPSDGSARQITTETYRTYVSFPHYTPELTPDGTGLYYLEIECAEGYYSPTSYAQIMRVNLDDLVPQVIGRMGKDAACGATGGPSDSWSLSPDGAQIAFGVNNVLGDDAPGYGLYVMDGDGQNLRLLFETERLAGFDWRGDMR